MTALRPVETRNVVAVAAEEYPSNRICAHPECRERVDLRPDGTPTVHHAFSRSKIKSASYFVSIDGGKPIPHAVGFCGSGTTGHHGDLEDQRARLVLEEGVWYWEDRYTVSGTDEGDKKDDWERLGALVPQPGSQEGREKKRPRKKGEERKKRQTISLRVPQDAEENGAEVLDTLVQAAREDLAPAMGWKDDVPQYYVLVAVLSDWLNGRPKKRRKRS